MVRFNFDPRKAKPLATRAVSALLESTPWGRLSKAGGALRKYELEAESAPAGVNKFAVIVVTALVVIFFSKTVVAGLMDAVGWESESVESAAVKTLKWVGILLATQATSSVMVAFCDSLHRLAARLLPPRS